MVLTLFDYVDTTLVVKVMPSRPKTVAAIVDIR